MTDPRNVAMNPAPDDRAVMQACRRAGWELQEMAIAKARPVPEWAEEMNAEFVRIFG